MQHVDMCRSARFLAYVVGVVLFAGSGVQAAELELRVAQLVRHIVELRISPFEGAGNQFTCDVTLRDESGQVAKRGKVTAKRYPQASQEEDRQVFLAEFSIDGLRPGTYCLQAQTIGSSSQRWDGEFQVHLQPGWLTAKAGIEGLTYVPKPYTPVVCKRGDDGLELSCLDRTVKLTDGQFITSIVSRGMPLLKSPVELVGGTGPFETFTATGSWQVVDHQPWAATVSGRFRSGRAGIRVTIHFEYDGFMWFELEPANTVSIRYLRLKIPFKSDVAKQVYFGKARYFGDLDTIVKTPRADTGWSCSAPEYLWVGAVDGGLVWSCDTFRSWDNPTDVDTTRVSATSDAVNLTIDILKGGATWASGPISFGLQPTPIKSWPDKPLHNQVRVFARDQQLLKPYVELPYLSYVLGNWIDPHAGTIDVYLSARFDTVATKDTSHREVFRIIREGVTFTLRWPNQSPGIETYVEIPSEKIRARHYVYLANKIKVGQWFRLTLTWRDGHVLLSYNGQPATPLTISSPKNLERLPLARIFSMGSHGDPALTFGANWAVDEFKILPQALTADEIDALDPKALRRLATLYDDYDSSTTINKIARALIPCSGVKGQGVLVGGITDRTAARWANELAYLASRGIKAVTLTEDWTASWGGTEPRDPASFKRLVREAHRHGLAVLPYFGFQIDDQVNDFERYKWELAVKGRAAERHGKTMTWLGTNRKLYMDDRIGPEMERLLAGMKTLLTEYEVDGFYFDGTILPGGGDNPYVVGRDRLGRTKYYPVIRKTRELAKRVRYLVDTLRPRGIIYGHTSSILYAPTVCFSDVIFNGENIVRYKPMLQTQWFLDGLPLDYYRILLNGYTWGVPMDDCNTGPWIPWQNMLAMLHHTGVSRPYDPLRDVWMQYRLSDARFLPYWSLDGRWPTRPTDVHTSAFQLSRDRYLVMAANFAAQGTWINLPLGDVLNVKTIAATKQVYPENMPDQGGRQTMYSGWCPAGTPIILEVQTRPRENK